MHARTLARVLALACLATPLAACQREIADIDGVFYDGDHRLVHCGIDLDTESNNDLTSIDSGLDRARDRHETVELYAHHPGATVPVDKIEHVLAGAAARGLAFVTYSDFAHGGGTGPALALSFDDTSVDAWVAMRPLFRRYHARITFFVSRFYELSDEARAGLHLLASDGHTIAAHTVHHLHAPDYVDENGLDAYLRDELDPSIQALRDEGFTVDAFAYPFGVRTDQLDHAIAKRVPVIRSVSFSSPESESPCPR